MSDHLNTAVVTTATDLDTAQSVLTDMQELLRGRHQLRLRDQGPAEPPWVTLDGWIRVDGVDRALGLQLAIRSTSDAERPACAVAYLDAALFRAVWDDDVFDEEAADRLRQLILALGANARVDGFRSSYLGSPAELRTFDAAMLRGSLLDPTSIADARQGTGLTHGLVSGILAAHVSLEQLRPIWVGTSLFETDNGFVVLDNLVEDDDEDEA